MRGAADPRDEGLQPLAPLGEGQGAQVLVARRPAGRRRGCRPGRPAIILASTVLRFSRCCRSPKRADPPVAQDQQFAVDDALEVQRLHHVGEGLGDVVAGAAVEPALAALAHRLHADAVPLPLGGVVGRDRAWRNRPPRRWPGPASPGGSAPACAGVGLLGAPLQPGEQVAVGRRQRVPDLLDLADIDAGSPRPRRWRPAPSWPAAPTTPTRRPPVISLSSAQRPSGSSASSQRSSRRRHLGAAWRVRRASTTSDRSGSRLAPGLAGQTRATVSARSPT